MIYVVGWTRNPNPKIGLPIDVERTFTEVFNDKKPMYSPIPRPWWRYSHRPPGEKPTEDRRLPANLLMVCKGLRYFNPDFYCDHAREWTVSARFLEFLQKRGLLTDNYEQSKLTVISTTQKPLAKQEYYLLRLFSSSNDLVDFDKTSKLISPIKPFTEFDSPFTYNIKLVFKPEMQVPALFYLYDESYFYSFFCNEEIKAAMEAEQFLGFDFYTLEEYAQMRIDWERRVESPAPDFPA